MDSLPVENETISLLSVSSDILLGGLHKNMKIVYYRFNNGKYEKVWKLSAKVRCTAYKMWGVNVMKRCGHSIDEIYAILDNR